MKCDICGNEVLGNQNVLIKTTTGDDVEEMQFVPCLAIIPEMIVHVDCLEKILLEIKGDSNVKPNEINKNNNWNSWMNLVK